MNKHLFAIFTYFTTFFVSVLLVGFVTPVKPYVATSCFNTSKTVIHPVNPRVETAGQSQIRNLLTFDQKFGFAYFAGVENANETENLVERMRSLDDSNLPIPFRKAYQAHTEAWDNYAKHLRNSGNHDDSDRECRILNRQISETYNTVLISAKNYGVDFTP